MRPIQTYEPSFQWDPEDLDSVTDQVREISPLSTPATHAKLAEYVMRKSDELAMTYGACFFGETVRILLELYPRDHRVIALCFAANLDHLHPYETMSQAAEALGVTVATISKAHILWRERLNLPRSGHAKSARAQQAYSDVQKAKSHWRNNTHTSSQEKHSHE